MELQVFSDPLAAIAGPGGLPYDEVNALSLYDEELVKPALLLADQVTLRTWRLDMQVGERIEGGSVRLAVPLMNTIRTAVYGGHEGAIKRLGISRELMRDLRLALEAHSREDDSLPDHRFFEMEAVTQFVQLWMDYHRGQVQALSSATLAELVEASILVEQPWDDRDLSRMGYPGADWTHNNQSLPYGWERMARELNEGSSAVLLDPVIDSALREAEGTVVQASAQTLGNAAGLMQMIDGLSTASMDEVLDIRRELSNHIKPFRSFLLRQAGDMDVDPMAPLGERQRQVALKWQADVAPAVDELRHKIEDDAFLRKLQSVAGSGPEAAIGVGLGLTTAIATGGVGVLALAGLGVAALPTIVKAAAASQAGKRDDRRNGAYLVVKMEDRFRKRLADEKASQKS